MLPAQEVSKIEEDSKKKHIAFDKALSIMLNGIIR